MWFRESLIAVLARMIFHVRMSLHVLGETSFGGVQLAAHLAEVQNGFEMLRHVFHYEVLVPVISFADGTVENLLPVQLHVVLASGQGCEDQLALVAVVPDRNVVRLLVKDEFFWSVKTGNKRRFDYSIVVTQ